MVELVDVLIVKLIGVVVVMPTGIEVVRSVDVVEPVSEVSVPIEPPVVGVPVDEVPVPIIVEFVGEFPVGVDPVEDVPVPVEPVDDVPVGEVPVRDVPVDDVPVNGVPAVVEPVSVVVVEPVDSDVDVKLPDVIVEDMVVVLPIDRALLRLGSRSPSLISTRYPTRLTSTYLPGKYKLHTLDDSSKVMAIQEVSLLHKSKQAKKPKT